MFLDLRPRCKWCRKIPRSKSAKDNYENRYPGYCSYGHQEQHNLHNAQQYLAYKLAQDGSGEL